jgi:hypothetical protein
MNQKNFSASTFSENLVEFGKTIIKTIRQKLRNFGEKYPNTAQKIQLTFLYFFAMIDLMFSILNAVLSFGYTSEIIRAYSPVIESILMNPFLQLWTSPERIFFLSYVVLELMVTRSVFGFSKLVRYNIILIFALLMVQGLVMNYWDLLFHRQISELASKWLIDEGALLVDNPILAGIFYFLTFVFFVCFYIFLYCLAIQGKFFQSERLSWLTDSVAFWLKIKTPTMRFGKRKKNLED